MAKNKTPKTETVEAPAGEKTVKDFSSKKTVCPIGRKRFAEKARQIIVDIGGTKVPANVKEFSTGSIGWYAQGKMDAEVDGVLVTVQIGLNLTVVGSKDLPKE